ncbi:Uncharacterized protein SCF082_LOCUS48153 [Durusdinium trenchii]|uniref:Uncharacterized protein n=1 Tax=Durusdinium trenchii TaxID=1381693 RepID=A0ABP0RUZ5_9DINO
MCVPDDVQYTYVIQPDGKCEAQANHIYARFASAALGSALSAMRRAKAGRRGPDRPFLELLKLMGRSIRFLFQQQKHVSVLMEFCIFKGRRYFEDDLEEDKQLLQYPPGRRGRLRIDCGVRSVADGLL